MFHNIIYVRDCVENLVVMKLLLVFNLVYTTGPLNSHGGLKLPQENSSRPNECSPESLGSLQPHWNFAVLALFCLFNNFHLIYYFVWRLPMLTRSLILLVARFDNHIL